MRSEGFMGYTSLSSDPDQGLNSRTLMDDAHMMAEPLVYWRSPHISFHSYGRRQGAKARSGMSAKQSTRSDASLQEQLEVGCRYACFCIPVIDPNTSNALMVWDLSLSVLLCLVAIIAPYETALLQPGFDSLFIFNRICDVFFCIDIFCQFITAQSDPDVPGSYITRPRDIATYYFKSWFIIDVVSAIPVDLLYLMFNDRDFFGIAIPRGFRNVKVIRLMRLARLLRLAKVQRLIVRWQTFIGMSYGLLSLIQFTMSLCLVSHWLACLWAAVGLGGDDEGWILALIDDKGHSKELLNEPFHIYCISLYWAVMTLTSIGYGDITATNHLEYVVATLCMLFMAGVWAYTIGAVCGIVASFSPHDAAFKQAIDDLNSMMHDQHMPFEMRFRLRKYFYSARVVNRRKAERGIVESLSPMLQGEVLLFGNKKYLQRVFYLKGLVHEAMVSTSRALVAQVYAPKEFMYQERTLFIMQSGLAMRHCLIYHEETLWGEDNLLLSNPVLWDTDGASALTFVQVLTLQSSDLTELLLRFPRAKRTVQRARMRLGLVRAMDVINRGMAMIGSAGNASTTEEDHTPVERRFSQAKKMQMWTCMLQGQWSQRTFQNIMCQGQGLTRSMSHSRPIHESAPEQLDGAASSLDNVDVVRMLFERLDSLTAEVAALSKAVKSQP